jgi:hypothetical protein
MIAISIIVALIRIIGITSQFYQAIAHMWVSFLMTKSLRNYEYGGLYQLLWDVLSLFNPYKWNKYGLLALLLIIVEVVCFVVQG